MKITVHMADRTIDVQARPGTLQQALTENGIAVSAPCGGHGLCGKCRAIVPGTLASGREAAFFTPEQRAAHWRLACLVEVFDGLECFVPDGGEAAIVTDGLSASSRLDPAAALFPFELPDPSLKDQRADLQRLRQAVLFDDVSLPAAAAVPGILRKNGFRGRAAVFGAEGRRTLLSAGAEASLAIAVDIGTTTVAAYLLDLETGRQLDVLSCLNPQAVHGADVITRADYATQKATGLAELSGAVRGCVAALCESFALRAGISLGDVHHIALCGNSVMMHLLAGLPVHAIAVSPFVPVYESQMHLPAARLDLPLPGAMATLLPCVAGYVGADTVAAVLASGMERDDRLTLLVDIGTNGEIVLGSRGRLLCCSTAAGPAFEGAHIQCGMGGVRGAVCKVGPELQAEVIGGGEAEGLCGSGLLDLLARLVQAEVVDFSGRLDLDALPEGWLDRAAEWDGKPAFRLEGEILLTQKDVREVQLAKGAIAAGIEVLCGRMGVRVGQIERVCLAGGFGSRLDTGSACRIGLLPPELETRMEAVGNGAGAGACLVVRDREALRGAQAVRDRMEYIELSGDKTFESAFVEHMLFE